MNAFIIAAPRSGSGKTTVTLALLAALTRRGIRTAPFKVGPDFIDPGHHAAACGQVSRNLDSWMCGADGVRRSFAAGCTDADVAVIEGVMGLFDGARGENDGGSSAEIARLLDVPVVLVVDAKGQARSVAAQIKGFVEFDSRLRFAGILLNGVASPRHAELLSAALASVPGLPPLLGLLPHAPELELPARHLGLVTAGDAACDSDYFSRLADWLEAGVDLDALLSGHCTTPHPPPESGGGARQGGGGPPESEGVPDRAGVVRIAVARDAAFCFCYPENLQLLEQAGAEIVFFSPLADTRLPAGCSGLYLPGGYPELHAAQLSANDGMLKDIRLAIDEGMPVYAECGGLIYLSQGIISPPPLAKGEEIFVGIFPATAHMLPRRKALGYRQVTFSRDTILGPAGTMARGHEFHYSEITMPEQVQRVYRMTGAHGRGVPDEGFVSDNVLASYVHLHFASNPALAPAFVDSCRESNHNPPLSPLLQRGEAGR
ncbi:MAG TPA: cobyrinate a,c-diamide synthase [Geobacterales bacterium]|nr:cobyrinate a,c-diamide synthase [Geobacterales bacterium]